MKLVVDDVLLVTADDRYLRKAGRLGKIVALDAWAPPSETIHG